MQTPHLRLSQPIFFRCMGLKSQMPKAVYLKRHCTTWNGMFQPRCLGRITALIAHGLIPEGLSCGVIMSPAPKLRSNGAPRPGLMSTLMVDLDTMAITR